MVSPQKENGFTAIANEIRDEIFLREFKPSHKDLLEFIWRLSYGCMGKKFAFIDNYKYFEIIGLKKTHVKERLNFLVDNNVLLFVKEFNLYVFNKNFDAWSIPKVSNYEHRKTLLKEILNINLSYQFSNEVTNLVTKLLKNSNEVTKKGTFELPKRELSSDSIPTAPTGEEVSKESIKESITTTITTVDSQELESDILKDLPIENPPSEPPIFNDDSKAVEEIANYFLTLTGRMATSKDYISITNTLNRPIAVPIDYKFRVDIIKKVMDKLTSKKNKNGVNEIFSFGFYRNAINDEYNKLEVLGDPSKYKEEAEAPKTQQPKNNSKQQFKNHIPQHENYEQRTYPKGHFDNIYEDI